MGCLKCLLSFPTADYSNFVCGQIEQYGNTELKQKIGIPLKLRLKEKVELDILAYLNSPTLTVHKCPMHTECSHGHSGLNHDLQKLGSIGRRPGLQVQWWLMMSTVVLTSNL